MEPAPPQDGFLVALGELAVEFSRLEHTLDSFIGFLVNEVNFRIGEIVVAELSVHAKITLLLSLYREQMPIPQAIEVLENRLDAIKKINKRRNEVVHSRWSVGPDFGLRNKQTAKYEKGLVHESVIVKVQDVRKLVNDVVQENMTLQDMLTKYVLG